jgi:hypothetical protein
MIYPRGYKVNRVAVREDVDRTQTQSTLRERRRLYLLEFESYAIAGHGCFAEGAGVSFGQVFFVFDTEDIDGDPGISPNDFPAAMRPTIVPTVTRRPRIHGLPPITFGSNVILSKPISSPPN